MAAPYLLGQGAAHIPPLLKTSKGSLMATHLIVGNSEDYHAVAVKWALSALGDDALIWDGIGHEEDHHLAIEPGDPTATVQLGGAQYRKFQSVWFRRAVKHRGLDHVAEHAKDFVLREVSEVHRCLSMTAVSASDFIVGGEMVSPTSIKSFQLDVAASMGLRTPRTLITNNPAKARAFVSAHGSVVVKPFAPHFWHDPEGKQYRVAATNVIRNPDDVTDDSVSACPSIFQELIRKVYELRVTVIGERVYAAKIQDPDGGAFMDWRFHVDHARFSSTSLEANLDHKLVSFVKRLGLKYGCIDLVVDQDENIYFLEINPSGQFLFLEQMIPGFPLLAAFTSMLRQASTGYQVHAQDRICTDKFEGSQAFASMIEARGKIVTDAPVMYSKVG